MARSISRIMDQIKRLQKQAEAIQQEAIVRIRKEIAQLGLTPEHLFGAVKPSKAAKAKSAARAAAVKFADDAGNTWGGMGKRPDWLRNALAAGKALEDFLVGQPAKADGAPKAANSKPATRRAKAAAAKTGARGKPARQVAAANSAVKASARKGSKAAAPKKSAPKKSVAKKVAVRKSRTKTAPADTAAN